MALRLPIAVTAPLLVGTPVAVVGVTLSVMWAGQSRQAITALADQNIEQIHKLVSAKVTDILSVPIRVSEVNAHLVRTGALNPADLGAWRSTFVEQARSFEMLSSIVWGGADGRSAWVTRYADGSYYWALKDDGDAPTMLEWRLDEAGEIGVKPTSTFEFDLFARPWYRTPVDAGASTWSEPFLWVGGEESDGVTLGLSYGVPLYDEAGALVGVVDADYSVNDLSSFLASIEIGLTGAAALVDRSGLLLAVSNDAPLATADGERLSAVDSDDALISAAARFVGETGEVRGTHAEVEAAGETHYVRASPVGADVGLEWTLLTIVPERDFIAEVSRDFQRSVVTSVLAVLAAVGVGLIGARWLVSPLLTLVTAVRRIGQGDLETQVTVRHAPEYENLAGAINQMTLGLQDRMRMRESLSLAMEVQTNLLPSEPPTVAGLDIAGHSTYCDETGGDYYDFLDLSDADEDSVVVAMGDVMGHGVAAALLMATARGILRSRCSVAGSMADFLEHVNGMLSEDTGGTRFMTLLLVTMSAAKRQMRWASAGHGPPILYDIASDSFRRMEGGGVPLGIMGEETYSEYLESDVGPGSVLIAATDGLWEAKNESNELYGMERVEALIRKHARGSAAAMSEAIRDALARWRGPTDPDDDLTFVIVKTL